MGYVKEWFEDEETQKQLRELARWLLIVPLILLLLFGCGSLALLETRAAEADTRSQLQADYSQWPFMVIAPINPEIVEEVKRDNERYEDPEEEEPVIVPGPFWNTPTPAPEATSTPTPGEGPTEGTSAPSVTWTPSMTATETETATETATESATATETATPTPSGPPPPIKPPVPPSNTYWFWNDSFPYVYMMRPSMPSGSNQSGDWGISFYSEGFSAGERLEAGTTTVNFYANNPSEVWVIFGVEMRVGGTSLGSGSFALPPNGYEADFYSASITTGAYDFGDGDRLLLRLNVTSPGMIYWDGDYNYSGVVIPSIGSSPTATSTETVTYTFGYAIAKQHTASDEHAIADQHAWTNQYTDRHAVADQHTCANEYTDGYNNTD